QAASSHRDLSELPCPLRSGSDPLERARHSHQATRSLLANLPPDTVTADEAPSRAAPGAVSPRLSRRLSPPRLSLREAPPRLARDRLVPSELGIPCDRYRSGPALRGRDPPRAVLHRRVAAALRRVGGTTELGRMRGRADPAALDHLVRVGDRDLALRARIRDPRQRYVRPPGLVAHRSGDRTRVDVSPRQP